VIVTPEQAFTILMALPESERVLTLVIAATGLRISEALGLQWQDVDYANQRINLRRVWVDNKVVERMKTEQSEAPATMSPTLAEVLKCWHQQTPYGQSSDWIFASSKLRGVNLEQPAFLRQIIFVRLLSQPALYSSRGSASGFTIFVTHWRPSS
jgi:integrase